MLSKQVTIIIKFPITGLLCLVIFENLLISIRKKVKMAGKQLEDLKDEFNNYFIKDSML